MRQVIADLATVTGHQGRFVDRATTCRGSLERQLPAVGARQANMPIEADHSRLKSMTSPVGGLERLRSAQSVSADTLRTKHAPRPLGSRHHGDPLRPVPERLLRSCSPRLRRPRHGPLLPPISQRNNASSLANGQAIPGHLSVQQTRFPASTGRTVMAYSFDRQRPR
jgi:hypothetical protein